MNYMVLITALSLLLYDGKTTATVKMDNSESSISSCLVKLFGPNIPLERTMGTVTPKSSNPCRWSLNAVQGQILLVTLDNLKLSSKMDVDTEATDNITLIMDGNETTFVSRTVNEYRKREWIGRSFELSWNNDNSSNSTFLLRYVVFSSDVCQVPEDVENVIVDGAIPGSFVSVGSTINYTCLSSSDILIAECQLNIDRMSSGPSWNNQPPTCHRHGHCNAIVKLASLNASQILAYDGRNDVNEVECVWEVTAAETASDNDIPLINLQLEWFESSDTSSSLEIYDGHRLDLRLLKRVTDGLVQPARFVAVHGKIIIVLPIVSNNSTITNSTNTYDWYGRFVSQASLCQPIPTAPSNGDLKGSEMQLNADLSMSSIVFTCNHGYRLVGVQQLDCMASGSWSASAPTCEPVVKLVLWSDKTMAKTPEPKLNTLSKAHPQSTEEKGYKKSSSKEDAAVKSPNPEDDLLDPSSPPFDNEFDTSYSGDPDIDSRIGQSDLYENTLTDYNSEDKLFDEVDEDSQLGQDGGDSRGITSRFPIMAIILAVTLPLLAGTIVIVSCLVYRKLYPVRMGPGRRFETFENPIYGRRDKRGSTMSGGLGCSGAATLASPTRLAQNPAELERLTMTDRSPSSTKRSLPV